MAIFLYSALLNGSSIGQIQYSNGAVDSLRVKKKICVPQKALKIIRWNCSK